MDADFSIDLGADDPVLDFPWKDPAGKLVYSDLKRQPALLSQVEEAAKSPELAEFLRTVNSARSLVESAKCDAWATTELNAEEEIFAASHKFASYVDLVVTDTDRRLSFPFHESFVRKLTGLLRKAPEMMASAEVCVRRCFFEQPDAAHEGFYFTVYVNGYGSDESGAKQSWAIGLRLLGTAIIQLSAMQ